MTYIHEIPDWPAFRWDAASLAVRLAAARNRQGRLLGRLGSLGFDLRREATAAALGEDLLKSAAIEGERLDAEEVRSSVARRLGLDVAGLRTPSRAVDGFAEVLIDATRQHAEPLTRERLWSWHASLFPTARSGMTPITVGGWRTDARGPMQVVSGPVGRERVHFEAPSASCVASEMAAFLKWIDGESTVDPVIKAGIAHLWFVTLHPFDDGNGRLARAITEMLLARADGSSDRFYSLSSAIESRRASYYDALEHAQRGTLDITAWIGWFLDCFEHALDSSEALLASVLFKARIWRSAGAHPLNTRQKLVLERMAEPSWRGHLRSSKYAQMAKCSQDTAVRDIRDLLALGLLIQNEGGGRSTTYRLADASELPE
ncbi:MAG: Fic family protein [Planctomycetota bacterium]